MSLIPLFRKDITSQRIAASATENGKRIYGLQLRYPRIIHSEFMTHRMLSKNAASSRAIPVASILTRDADMFVPNFRHNKAGMQPGEYLSATEQSEAAAIWQDAANYCIEAAKKLAAKDGLNVHKQWANRMLEWFGYIDVLCTATEFANFDHLRDHYAAQEEIRLLAIAMKESRHTVHTVLKDGEWHLPYITQQDRLLARTAAPAYRGVLYECLDTFNTLPDLSLPDALLLVASAARCCRLSYSKLDGTPTTFREDIERFQKLVPSNDPVHASPLEHQATPLASFDPKYQANFRGWAQFRQFIPNQAVEG